MTRVLMKRILTAAAFMVLVACGGRNGLLLDPGAPVARAPDHFKVRFETTKGAFIVEAYREWAPLGVDRFHHLVQAGFYDGAAFFRVVEGFVVQFGLNRSPEVNAAWEEARIPDDPVQQSNQRGFLTFATGGPHTRTTQLFINLVDNRRLDRMGFAPIGRVVEGMQIVDILYSGYGEGAPRGKGPSQERIATEGSRYLERDFPRLDSIKRARIVG